MLPADWCRVRVGRTGDGGIRRDRLVPGVSVLGSDCPVDVPVLPCPALPDQIVPRRITADRAKSRLSQPHARARDAGGGGSRRRPSPPAHPCPARPNRATPRHAEAPPYPALPNRASCQSGVPVGCDRRCARDGHGRVRAAFPALTSARTRACPSRAARAAGARWWPAHRRMRLFPRPHRASAIPIHWRGEWRGHPGPVLPCHRLRPVAIAVQNAPP
jgi:hypothetical protein